MIPNGFIGREAARILDEAVEQTRRSNGTGPMLGSGCDGISMSQTPGGQVVTQDHFRTTINTFFGVCVKAGPNKEPDYTDDRYWVREVYFKQDAGAAQTDPVACWVQAGGFWGTIENSAENALNTHQLSLFDSDAATGPDDVQVDNGTILQITQVDGVMPSSGDDSDTGGNYLFAAAVPPAPRYRIVSVANSFPAWDYEGAQVIGWDSSGVGPEQWVIDTNAPTIQMLNRAEWIPASYPYTHANGVTVVNNTGAVATTFGGTDPSTCLIRSIGVGSVVDVWTTLDESEDGEGGPVYSFYVPNSAQG